MICGTCKAALDTQKIPILSTYNGFKYPEMPSHLSKLDIISERLISPRVPFMQIRRLRHIHGECGIYGQVINVPISVNSMVNQLPRNIDNDHCVHIHIEKEKIHASSDLDSLVDKQNIKIWLKYLINTPLYIHYKIIVDNSFLNEDEEKINQIKINKLNEFSEDISIEDCFIAQQQTLLWNDENISKITPGKNSVSKTQLFDEYAEELSFPTIYLGQFRKFRNNIKATPFMIASSELRRKDRRGVTPHHLLYVAVKIMRMRIRDCFTVAFKHIGINNSITRQQIESEQYVNNCIESNLAFLRSIPNSPWYWAQKKKDLFAIIRQNGRPTAFMTLSANEIEWPNLLQLLYKLANNGDNISERAALKLNFMQKCTLINEDAVTCAIYFSKLVNVLLDILQSKECNPFGKYRIIDYFKRIEFQHGGSPHVHILLWLENAPDDFFDKNYNEAIALIDSLVSVSASQASEKNIERQTHKHIYSCFEENNTNKSEKCKFKSPFMPCSKTIILTPMQKTDSQFGMYSQRYIDIRSNLETFDYQDLDDFYEKNNIKSEDEYRNILRAGITKPTIFYKRLPSEKLYNPFNPFILNILKSNMNFQIITEEHSCAAYIGEYFNKMNGGISNLQRRIIELINENPKFDIVEITKRLNVDIFNNVEMSSQEAAWYLLREPTWKSSVDVCYINTVWPTERQKIKKTQKELIQLDENSTDIWKEDWFDKYQKRPNDLEDVTLAQFVSKYYKNNYNIYKVRKKPRVICYRNFDIKLKHNEYKREMVTLHIPFRDEHTDVLADMKYLKVYDQNEDLILENKKEFEFNLEIENTIAICRQTCHENDESDNNNKNEIQDVVKRFSEANPFQELYYNSEADIEFDVRSETSNKLGVFIKEINCSSKDRKFSNNKTIVTKRNYFPSVSGHAMSLYKSQNKTTNKIVCKYNRSHSHLSEYLALSSAKKFKELCIVTSNNESKYYHNRRENTLIISLQEEFRRLSSNRFEIIGGIIKDFITVSRNLSMFNFNCQSLRKHNLNIADTIKNPSNVLLLSETWMNNNVDINVPNFNCIVKFKRNDEQIPRIIIHHDVNDTYKVITSNMELQLRNVREIDVGQSNIGEICIAQCVVEDGREIILIIVYISPNNTIQNIITFLHRRLFCYELMNSRALGESYYKLPLILAGDFNVDFTSDDAQPLIEFLYNKFQLNINNNPKEIKTRYDTVDVVFSRYLERLNCRTYILLFSYHRHVGSSVKSIVHI